MFICYIIDESYWHNNHLIHAFIFNNSKLKPTLAPHAHKQRTHSDLELFTFVYADDVLVHDHKKHG